MSDTAWVVLVTGSRRWRNVDAITKRLRLYDSKRLGVDRSAVLVHGAHWEGADAIADKLARSWGWRVLEMPAQWKRYGNSAGPIRNRGMVRVVHELVLCGYRGAFEAFLLPDASGTAGCIEAAESRRVDYQEWHIEEAA